LCEAYTNEENLMLFLRCWKYSRRRRL